MSPPSASPDPFVSRAFCAVLPQFDLRNLLVVNPHQVDEDALANDTEEYLKGQAQAAVQSLINRRAKRAIERVI